MPRKYRLTGLELKDIRGIRLHGTLFSLLVAPVIGAPHAKCACVVSKKVAVRAPERNLVKRRCRAALSGYMSSTREPRALVFHAKAGAAEASFAQIQSDVKSLLARAAQARS